MLSWRATSYWIFMQMTVLSKEEVAWGRHDHTVTLMCLILKDSEDPFVHPIKNSQH